MAKFKGLTKSCEVCGAAFRVPQSADRVRTCSRECGYKIRRVANKAEAVRMKCAACGGIFESTPGHAGRRTNCSRACADRSAATSAKKSTAGSGSRNSNWRGGVSIKTTSATGRQYLRQRPHIEARKDISRKRSVAQATPAWANQGRVAEIYLAAKRARESTGLMHHVDHIVPLKGKTACGLHNEFNLRVVMASENLRKSNQLLEQ